MRKIIMQMKFKMSIIRNKMKDDAMMMMNMPLVLHWTLYKSAIWKYVDWSFKNTQLAHENKLSMEVSFTLKEIRSKYL